jgi:hypothetical protein
LAPAALAAAIGIVLVVVLATGWQRPENKGHQAGGRVPVAGVPAGRATCQIVGDSIAVGLHRVLPGCTWNAKVGIPSGAIIARVAPAAFLVVSAGSNDSANPRLAANLEAIRSRAAGAVIWVLPAVPRARAVVADVAAAHRDRTVTFLAGRDHVHPRSYADLARAVLLQLNQGASS